MECKEIKKNQLFKQIFFFRPNNLNDKTEAKILRYVSELWRIAPISILFKNGNIFRLFIFTKVIIKIIQQWSSVINK